MIKKEFFFIMLFLPVTGLFAAALVGTTTLKKQTMGLQDALDILQETKDTVTHELKTNKKKLDILELAFKDVASYKPEPGMPEDIYQRNKSIGYIHCLECFQKLYPKTLSILVRNIPNDCGRVGAYDENCIDIVVIASPDQTEFDSCLILIDSLGGDSYTVKNIAKILYTFKENYKLPIVSYVIGNACSAGYYVATFADCIVSSDNNLCIGGIGSCIKVPQAIDKKIQQIPEFSGRTLFLHGGQNKISEHLSLSKNLFLIAAFLSPEDIKLIDDRHSGLRKDHQLFRDHVNANRYYACGARLADEDTDGIIFSAADAVKKRMIDKIGSFVDVVAELRSRVVENEKFGDFIVCPVAEVIAHSRPVKGVADTAHLFLPQENSLRNKLLLAVQNNKFDEVLRLVLSEKADVNAVVHKGFTPLLYAVLYASEEISSFLLEHGADISCKTYDGYTLLMLAIMSRRSLGFIKQLICKGVDIHAVSSDGWSASKLAIASRRLDVFRLFESRKDSNIGCSGSAV